MSSRKQRREKQLADANLKPKNRFFGKITYFSAKGKAIMATCTAAGGANFFAASIFKVYPAEIKTFMSSYSHDMLGPFAAYWAIKLLDTVQAKSSNNKNSIAYKILTNKRFVPGLVFAFCAADELFQLFLKLYAKYTNQPELPIFRYDTMDFVAFGAGVGLAVLTDKLLFKETYNKAR